MNGMFTNILFDHFMLEYVLIIMILKGSKHGYISHIAAVTEFAFQFDLNRSVCIIKAGHFCDGSDELVFMTRDAWCDSSPHPPMLSFFKALF